MSTIHCRRHNVYYTVVDINVVSNMKHKHANTLIR